VDSIFPRPTQINSWALSKVGAMLVSLFQISMLFLPSNISFWVDSNSSFNHIDSLTRCQTKSLTFFVLLTNSILIPKPPISFIRFPFTLTDLLHGQKNKNKKEEGSLQLKHQLFRHSCFSLLFFSLTLLCA